MKNKNYRKWYLFLLGILIAGHLIGNALFLKKYPLPEGKDSGAHVAAFLKFSQIFQRGQLHPMYVLEKNKWNNLVFIVVDYPPFFYFSAFTVDFLLRKFCLNAPLLTSTLYFILLIVSVYGIGCAISRRAGLLSACICSFYPIIYSVSRHFNLEMALCAMVAFNVLILQKTDFFAKRNFSLFLGVMFGAGMLVKQTFIVYLLGPLLVTLLFAFRAKDKKERINSVVNFGIFTITAFLVSLPFYHNPEIYINALNRTQFRGAVAAGGVFSPAHLLYYPESLINTIGLFFLGLFIISLLFIKRLPAYLRSLLCSWICLPIFVFSLFPLKYGEYLIPSFPALAVVSAAGLLTFKYRYLRIGIIALVLSVGIINYFNMFTVRGSFFYSTFHPRNPRLKVTACAADNNRGHDMPASFDDVLHLLGDLPVTVGVCYDDTNLSFSNYFLFNTFSRTKREAAIVDFSFSTAQFFANLDRCDFFLFASRSGNEWFTPENLDGFIRKFNAGYIAKVCFEEGEAHPEVLTSNKLGAVNTEVPFSYRRNLLSMRERLKKLYVIDFREEDSRQRPQKIYVYRRKR
ncbi:MAG: glycosyltransferase family 39 protein [Candidatus Omnitrophica bacterium]|nr:glycosyltransferase family 39 protein [Candidatus Omnitrophota bacterium]